MLLMGTRATGAGELTRAAAAAAAIGLAGLLAVVPAHADPLNPRDPDYCGDSADILFCTEHLSTYPSAGETAFLGDIRGRFPPGTEARRLAAGRAVCLELPSHPRSLIVDQIAVYLQTSKQVAGQVVDSARTNICPAVAP